MRMRKDPEFFEDGFDASPFGPPETCGVYAICVSSIQEKTLRVIYIGSSQNIKKRLTSMKHPYRRVFGLVKSLCVGVMYKECDDYVAQEASLIFKYKPRFNRVGI